MDARPPTVAQGRMGYRGLDMGDKRYGPGDRVSVVPEHEDRAGMRGVVTETGGPLDDHDCYVRLRNGETIGFWDEHLVPDTSPSTEDLQSILDVLRRAKVLVGLVGIGAILDAGDAAIDASGLNPWCVNEGRATREDKTSTWWIDGAIEKAEAMVAASKEGEVEPEGA